MLNNAHFLPSERVKRGWMQGQSWEDRNGVHHVCAARAICEWHLSQNMASHDWRELDTYRNALQAHLGTLDLVRWNDDPMRDKEEVIRALQHVERRLGLNATV